VGKVKKKAKHSAAKSILEAILSGTNNEEPTSPTKEHPENGASSVLSHYDDGIPGNPVGALQEFCMSRRWPPPSYTVVEEEGLPHERKFTMCCSVKKYVEKGNGKSKKLAKRQAAFKMHEKLKEIAPGKAENATNLEEDEDEHFLNFKENKIPSLTPAFSQKISQFYRSMKLEPGQTLSRLHKTSLSPQDLNCIQFLQDIATEHIFDVTYVDIEERSNTEKFQCLVQLSTLPVAVCHGTGDTAIDARTNAAENALEYLKLMTRE